MLSSKQQLQDQAPLSQMTCGLTSVLLGGRLTQPLDKSPWLSESASHPGRQPHCPGDVLSSSQCSAAHSVCSEITRPQLFLREAKDANVQVPTGPAGLWLVRRWTWRLQSPQFPQLCDAGGPRCGGSCRNTAPPGLPPRPEHTRLITWAHGSPTSTPSERGAESHSC